LLTEFGLRVDRQISATKTTSPADFHRLFPATGGALYGPASHGWRTSFSRAASRSAIPGLYLAGGSTHPGPGVPMAATSGRLAAAAIMTDFASIARSRTAAMSGGTSMR
jgi:1-hydroxycarotenoid 3,4-desaturase